jgi:hypothetical protein
MLLETLLASSAGAQTLTVPLNIDRPWVFVILPVNGHASESVAALSQDIPAPAFPGSCPNQERKRNSLQAPQIFPFQLSFFPFHFRYLK